MGVLAERRIALLALGFSALMVSLAFLAVIVFVRARRQQRLVARIPRHHMPLGKNDVNKAVLGEIWRETDRAFRVRITPDADTACPLGWGAVAGAPVLGGAAPEEMHPVDLKRALAESHVVLENAAVLSNPGLRRDKVLPVRDYAEHLLAACPQLRGRRKMVLKYVAAYERARFSPATVTLDECNTALRTLHFIASVLREDEDLGGDEDAG